MKGKRRYIYFIVQREIMVDGQEPFVEYPKVIRGLSMVSVQRRLAEEDMNDTIKADYGGNYAPFFYTKIITSRGEKAEAEKVCKLLTMAMMEEQGKRNRKCPSDSVEAPYTHSNGEDEELHFSGAESQE